MNVKIIENKKERQPYEYKWVSLNQWQIDALTGFIDGEIDRCEKHHPAGIPFYQSIKDRLNE